MQGLIFPSVSEAKTNLTSKPQVYELEDASLEFLAVGRPSFLKIRGEGARPEGEFAVKDGEVRGVAHVDLRRLKTGIELRDEHLHERYAQTEKYPKAELSFQIVQQRIGEIIADHTADMQISVPGRLRWRDRERELPIQVQRKKSQFEVEFKFRLSEFGIEMPQYAGVKVADEVQVKVLSQIRSRKLEQ
jgi:polyisoprenoid-binding protein YceI